MASSKVSLGIEFVLFICQRRFSGIMTDNRYATGIYKFVLVTRTWSVLQT